MDKRHSIPPVIDLRRLVNPTYVGSSTTVSSTSGSNISPDDIRKIDDYFSGLYNELITDEEKKNKKAKDKTKRQLGNFIANENNFAQILFARDNVYDSHLSIDDKKYIMNWINNATRENNVCESDRRSAYFIIHPTYVSMDMYNMIQNKPSIVKKGNVWSGHNLLFEDRKQSFKLKEQIMIFVLMNYINGCSSDEDNAVHHENVKDFLMKNSHYILMNDDTDVEKCVEVIFSDYCKYQFTKIEKLCNKNNSINKLISDGLDYYMNYLLMFGDNFVPFIQESQSKTMKLNNETAYQIGRSVPNPSSVFVVRDIKNNKFIGLDYLRKQELQFIDVKPSTRDLFVCGSMGMNLLRLEYNFIDVYKKYMEVILRPPYIITEERPPDKNMGKKTKMPIDTYNNNDFVTSCDEDDNNDEKNDKAAKSSSKSNDDYEKLVKKMKLEDQNRQLKDVELRKKELLALKDLAQKEWYNSKKRLMQIQQDRRHFQMFGLKLFEQDVNINRKAHDKAIQEEADAIKEEIFQIKTLQEKLKAVEREEQATNESINKNNIKIQEGHQKLLDKSQSILAKISTQIDDRFKDFNEGAGKMKEGFIKTRAILEPLRKTVNTVDSVYRQFADNLKVFGIYLAVGDDDDNSEEQYKRQKKNWKVDFDTKIGDIINKVLEETQKEINSISASMKKTYEKIRKSLIRIQSVKITDGEQMIMEGAEEDFGENFFSKNVKDIVDHFDTTAEDAAGEGEDHLNHDINLDIIDSVICGGDVDDDKDAKAAINKPKMISQQDQLRIIKMYEERAKQMVEINAHLLSAIDNERELRMENIRESMMYKIKNESIKTKYDDMSKLVGTISEMISGQIKKGNKFMQDMKNKINSLNAHAEMVISLIDELSKEKKSKATYLLDRTEAAMMNIANQNTIEYKMQDPSHFESRKKNIWLLIEESRQRLEDKMNNRKNKLFTSADEYKSYSSDIDLHQELEQAKQDIKEHQQKQDDYNKKLEEVLMLPAQIITSDESLRVEAIDEREKTEKKKKRRDGIGNLSFPTTSTTYPMDIHEEVSCQTTMEFPEVICVQDLYRFADLNGPICTDRFTTVTDFLKHHWDKAVEILFPSQEIININGIKQKVINNKIFFDNYTRPYLKLILTDEEMGDNFLSLSESVTLRAIFNEMLDNLGIKTTIRSEMYKQKKNKELLIK